MGYVLGVDVGGTFTDAVAIDGDGAMVSAKTPSTPPDYGNGVVNAIEILAHELGLTTADLLADTDYIAHGTTSSLKLPLKTRDWRAATPVILATT